MDIPGSVALVTGGAHRVGRGIALGLAAAGADVVVHHRSSDDAAKETVAAIEGLGRKAAIVHADLSHDGSAAQVIDEATDALGPVNILVNSAAGFPEDTLQTVTLEGLEEAMRVNLAAAVLLTKAFVAALDGSEGAVVNVTDWKTQRPYLKHFSYMLTKGALDTFTLAAAAALAPTIRVNAVALGPILPPAGKSGDYEQGLIDGVPLGRLGGVETVADAVVHLVQNHFVTGEIVRLTGGAHLV